MMENKYYTPDIEDIRVGYECEQLIDYITHNEWKKEIFGKGCWLPEGDVGGIMHWYHTCIINKRLRTAYLTKEQIEGEQWKGWTGVASYEKTAPHLYVSKRQGKDYTDLINVIYNIDTHELVVYKKGEVIFNGLCLSINEFRIITNKLLQIK